MKRNFGIVLTLIILVATSFACYAQGLSPVAQKGVIDLSSWDFSKNGVAYLDGEWEFFQNDFISVNNSIQTKSDYLKVPSIWGELETSGKQLVPNFGFGSYKLKIKLAKRQENLAIRFSPPSTSFELWINGILAMEGGKIGTSKDSTIPYNGGTASCNRRVINFDNWNSSDEVNLTVRVANFQDIFGGAKGSFEIGTKELLPNKERLNFAMDFFNTGCLFIVFLYYLNFFLMRRNDKSMFYLCVLSLAGIFRTISCGEVVVAQFFTSISWELIRKMEYVGFYLGVLAALKLFESLFSQELPKKFVKVYTFIAIPLIMLVVFTPFRVFALSLRTYQIMSVSVIFVIVFATVLAVKRRREGARVELFGFIFMAIASINDMFISLDYIKGEPSAPYAITAFISLQAIVISRKFGNAFTQIENMSEKLVKLDKQKDEMLAITSHELKTPINGIIGISESLIDGITGKLAEKTIENLKVIIASGKRLKHLVNDILDFSKLKNKEIVLQTKNVDVKNLVGIVIATIKTTIENKNVSLINIIDDKIPYVWADENRLQQILFNLIGNAIKFTHKGSVVISAVKNESKVVLMIEDTGIGIPRDRFEDVFKSFEQVDASIEREYGGSGLGLTISKKLVELHGGEIWIESKVGIGSKFYFSLPIGEQIKKDKATRDAESLVIIESMSLEKAAEEINAITYDEAEVRVLVVDDEKINRQVLLNHLSIEGYHVTLSENGFDALEKIKERAYDLVLLDVMMPKMSGFEVCRKIRETFNIIELPILIITAKNEMEDMVIGLESGANDYVQKPFEKHVLMLRIKTLLSLKASVKAIWSLNEEIESTQKEILFTLGEVAEARSNETGYHIKRVAEYSYLLAKKAGLSEEEADLLRLASPMHDLGKLAVRDDILNKPGKLTTDEFEVMKKHATIGFDMLNKSERRLIKTGALIALEHHEKYDGTGYPSGLKGEGISLLGRITAIADVFDALGSDRVYKKAWEMDKIIEFFKEQRGKHFDPNLIDIFLQNLNEFIEIKDRYLDNKNKESEVSK